MPKKKMKAQKDHTSGKSAGVKMSVPEVSIDLPDLKSAINKASEASENLVSTVEESTFLKTTLSDLGNAIGTVSEVSKGLTLAIENTDTLNTFNNVLDMQNSIGQQTVELQERFKMYDDGVNRTLVDITGPMSGAIADVGMSIVSAQKSFETGLIDSKGFQAAQSVSDLCLNALEIGQSSALSGLYSVNEARDFNAMTEDAIPSLKMISGGLSEVTLSNPVISHDLDLPSLTVVHSETAISDVEIEEYQKKLDEMLSQIDEELVEYRKGCWETFFAKGKDYLGQSSSSMRRLVDSLLRTAAPKEEVMKTEYFKNCKDAKKDSMPTRKARVYYLLGYDKDSAERFRRLAKAFLATYDNLSAWDHQPLKADDFVHGVFITIEGHLLSLLSEWFKEE